MMAAVQLERPVTVEAVLLAERMFRETGTGPATPLAENRGRALDMVLEITRAIDCASLAMSISGSADGDTWEPLICLPRKYYCGTYPVSLDLSSRPEIRYLRADWTVGRIAPTQRQPAFTGSLRILSRHQDSRQAICGALSRS